jgi:hypothetical protein
VAHGRVEAAKPVSGSVLAHRGTLVFAAGRSSYLDGGISLMRVDPADGRILARRTIYSPDPATGHQPPATAPAVVPGVRTDLLVADDRFVYLIDNRFRPDDLAPVADGDPPPHLFALTGFLDESWPHRSYWGFGRRPTISIGCQRRARELVFGRVLVYDRDTIYGYGRAEVHWSNPLRDGAYRLFAVKRDPGGTPFGKKIRWQKKIPITVKALLLAGGRLFAAGPVMKTESGAPRKAAALVVLAAATGEQTARVTLPAVPAFDGMAAARGRLFLTTRGGRVLCLGKPD